MNEAGEDLRTVVLNLRRGMPMLAAALLWAAATPVVADGSGLTCGDLRAAAAGVCLAKYQCAVLAPKISVWTDKLCECLEAGEADSGVVVLDGAGFSQIGFACCAGNAIMSDPSICKTPAE